MDFRNIDLPGFLLADLYKDDLVLVNNDNVASGNPRPKQVEEAAAISVENPPVREKEANAGTAGITYLGSNKKHISIVVKDDQAIHLRDESLDILSAILSACKLNLADVAIINMHRQFVDDNGLRREFSPRVVLLFGVQTTDVDLPFSIPLYKPQPFNNCNYVQAVSLENLAGNSTEARLEKSKLWVCLKNLFGV